VNAFSELAFLAMENDVRELRAATLDNNLLWLESFGCKVRRAAGCIHVEHPWMPDYVALLVTGEPGEFLRELQMSITKMGPPTTAPDIYVDATSINPAVRSILDKNGFYEAALSLTMSGCWTPKVIPNDLQLRPVAPTEIDRWSSLYSRGFRRTGRDAQHDRVRWRHAYDSPYVRHWFLGTADRLLGVCQTCTCSGVTGIYSFTILPPERGFRMVRMALRAIQAKLTQDGRVTVYFERVKKTGRSIRPPIRPPTDGLRVIRTWIRHCHI
jgi:hypothetical protein